MTWPMPMPHATASYLRAALPNPPRAHTHNLAGIHYLANALQQIAMNSSIPVLSFDLEPASGEHGIRVASAHTHPTGQPSSVGPKLKAKRLRDKSVELSVRQVRAVSCASLGPTLRAALSWMPSVGGWSCRCGRCSWVCEFS